MQAMRQYLFHVVHYKNSIIYKQTFYSNIKRILSSDVSVARWFVLLFRNRSIFMEFFFLCPSKDEASLMCLSFLQSALSLL